MPSKYPQSFKDRAMRRVFDRLEDEEPLAVHSVIKLEKMASATALFQHTPVRPIICMTPALVQ